MCHRLVIKAGDPFGLVRCRVLGADSCSCHKRRSVRTWPGNAERLLLVSEMQN